MVIYDRHHPIVVGVDGSASALDAVRWAARQAARHSAGLRLVHAVEPASLLPSGIGGASRTALQDHGRRLLTEAVDVATETAPDVPAESVAETGATVPMLVAQSEHAALVVVGNRGLGGFAGMFVGSRSVALIGRAHCPVVVVRDGATDTGPVVVGVDGTAAGEAAIGFAFSEAAVRGAPLVAVHSWAESAVAGLLSGRTMYVDYQALERDATNLVAERLRGWQEKYPDVEVAREVVQRRDVPALLEHSAAAGLMVVGSRGHGGFRGLLAGSTSQQLVHHAECPVAVVRTETGG